MGDDANQFILEGVICVDNVNRIEFECRAFSIGNMDAQERRRQVECALNRVMPWNDVHFFRVNLPHSHPFESNNSADYRHIIADNMGATTRVCIGTSTFWCIPSLLKIHCKYFERHIRRVSLVTIILDITYVRLTYRTLFSIPRCIAFARALTLLPWVFELPTIG